MRGDESPLLPPVAWVSNLSRDEIKAASLTVCANAQSVAEARDLLEMLGLTGA